MLSYQELDKIDLICHEYGIGDFYRVNQDGSIDVDKDVNLSHRNLYQLPLKFNKINGHFSCEDNKLSNLNGCPREIKKYFNCGHNDLTTLVGGPNKVGGGYYCEYNHLKDVHGFPEYFYGTVGIESNPVYEIIRLVSAFFEEKFIKWLNEFDVIRKGSKIVEMRLEEAYWMTMKEELPMDERTFKNYTLI